MPAFVCTNCGTVDNTALGHYWMAERNKKKGRDCSEVLCCICAPAHHHDGSPRKDYTGKWHNRFKRQYLPIGEWQLQYPNGCITNIRTGETNWVDYLSDTPYPKDS